MVWKLCCIKTRRRKITQSLLRLSLEPDISFTDSNWLESCRRLFSSPLNYLQMIGWSSYHHWHDHDYGQMLEHLKGHCLIGFGDCILISIVIILRFIQLAQIVTIFGTLTDSALYWHYPVLILSYTNTVLRVDQILI